MGGHENLVFLGFVAAMCIWAWIVITNDMPNIRSLWERPDYEKSKGYLAAREWLSKLKQPPSIEGYDKALEYAWKRFDQAQSASEALDKKADNLMRNAAIVAGLRLGNEFVDKG